MKIEREKKRLTLQEAATAVGISKDTLSRWERRGLIRPSRDWRGARIYAEHDIVELRRLAGLAGGGGDGQGERTS
jgi:DNA-binding transcriptional MerR regulator